MKTTTAVYHIYQEAEFKRTKVRECIVKKASFIYFCGAFSYTAFLEDKMMPRPIEVHPDYREATFSTNKLKISPDIELSTKKGVITQETITIGGKIDYDGTCSGKQTIFHVLSHRFLLGIFGICKCYNKQ